MPIYATDTQLYSCFQSLFAVIEQNEPKAADALLKSGLAITLKSALPTAAITIDARKSPVQLHYGQTSLKPTIEVGLSGDTLHCLLLGEIRLTKAIGSDLVDLKGPVWKCLPLADLFHYAQRFYPGILLDTGLPTTCPDLTRA